MQRVKRETRHRPCNNYERAGQQAHNKPGKNEACKKQELTWKGLELPGSGPAAPGHLLRLQLVNEIFRPGLRCIPSSNPADPNLRPWTLAPIKNALNQPLFFAASPLGSKDKNRCQFSRHWCRPSEIARFPPWAVKKIEKAFNHTLFYCFAPG